MSLSFRGQLCGYDERNFLVYVLSIGFDDVTASAEARRGEVRQKVGQTANWRQMRSLICAYMLRDECTLFHRWQFLVLLQSSRIEVSLILYIVLLHDLHLRKLVLIDQCLGEHLVGDEWQSAILATVEHFVSVLVVREAVLLLVYVLA